MILDKATAADAAVTFQRGQWLTITNDTYAGRDLRRRGAYSPEELDLWGDLVTPGAIVADVGANIGAHAVPLAKMVGLEGLVLAFEPLPWLYRILCANTVLNGCPNVLPFHAAIGAKPGTIRVPGIDYTQPDTYGGLALGGYTADQGNAVPLLTLDAIASRLDAMKIDVEGMELDVLHGARRHLAAGAIVYCEAHHPPPLVAFLKGEGYRVWHHHPKRYPERADSPASPMILALKGRHAPDGHGLEAA